jgi:hypothetical protein
VPAYGGFVFGIFLAFYCFIALGCTLALRDTHNTHPATTPLPQPEPQPKPHDARNPDPRNDLISVNVRATTATRV